MGKLARILIGSQQRSFTRSLSLPSTRTQRRSKRAERCLRWARARREPSRTALHQVRARYLSPTASSERGSSPRDHLPLLERERSGSRVTDPLTHVVLPPPSPCPVSHVNLRRGPRKEERREIGTRSVGELTGPLARMNVENRRKGCGLECPLLGRPCAVGVFLLHQHRYVPLFPLTAPARPLPPASPSSSSVHSGALALCLSLPRPRYMDRRKSPSSLSYQQAALAHSDTAFILCPSHLRLAGDQPKCAPVHGRSLGRADRGSYESAREPLAWGTRRKSIILNHGMIGSNDQTTARRASLRGDSRGRATSCLAAAQEERILPFPSRALFHATCRRSTFFARIAGELIAPSLSHRAYRAELIAANLSRRINRALLRPGRFGAIDSRDARVSRCRDENGERARTISSDTFRTNSVSARLSTDVEYVTG